MPNDTGHRHATLAPWWSEREVEIIVLDVRITIDASLDSISTSVCSLIDPYCTYYTDIITSPCKMMCHGFGNGRLFSYAKDLRYHVVDLKVQQV